MSQTTNVLAGPILTDWLKLIPKGEELAKGDWVFYGCRWNQLAHEVKELYASGSPLYARGTQPEEVV